MTSTSNNDDQSKLARVGSLRWTRVREACHAGELDRKNALLQPERKRQRRNALADTSAISTNADASSQKHQFHQLVERVRELQQEIVPDLLLYQLPTNYPSFSTVTPSSNAARKSISNYPHRQSTSFSSGSSNSSTSNQRLNLSARILERAHQIPERFWIDWQQKQMQDQLEELEYIKNNMAGSSNSSLLSNETDENGGTEPATIDQRTNHDENHRKSLLFLHEAHRLANERRASLARGTTFDDSPTLKNTRKIPRLSEEDNRSSFDFDQRSEEVTDPSYLDDLNEEPSPEPITPVPTIQTPEVDLKPPRLPISLPFTYTNTREQVLASNSTRQTFLRRPMLQRVNEVHDNSRPSTTSIDTVGQLDNKANLTMIKRERPNSNIPLLYSKATIQRSIEFRRIRPISVRNNTASSKKDSSIHIPILQKTETDDSRSSSPTLSFKSARSRLSSIDKDDDHTDDIRSISVLPSSLSTCSSHFTVSHLVSTIFQWSSQSMTCPSLKQVLLPKCICASSNLSMSNIYGSEEKHQSSSSSSSSSSITSFEEVEEDRLSFSRTLFTSRPRPLRRKKKGNAFDLSSISTSSQKNLTLPRDSFCRARKKNYKDQRRTFNITHNTSVISSEGTWRWKQKNGGFQRDLLANDNSDDDDDGGGGSQFILSTSSSSSAAAAIDCFPQRQRRKQTRLKRKTKCEKKKGKKEKREEERNKKSPSSTTGAEATEASLFQFFAVDSPTIGTSAPFYPHEQARCAEKSTAEEKNCFSIQTSAEYQQQKHHSTLNSAMADHPGNIASNPVGKKKENVRVFVHRRRRNTKPRKRIFQHSSSSSHSHETIPSSPNSVEELVAMIQQQMNKKQNRSRHNKSIVVVNYKPVFLNSRQQKPSHSTTTTTANIKAPSPPKPIPIIIPTDDEVSSATHYSRPRSLTTTSSDGSPLRSTPRRSHNQPSVSLDVPDVEDPLMFIELMYQQLFTEDGRLRSGTEPTVLANCVKQIVTNSRRNSVSSSVAKSSGSSRLKPTTSNVNSEQRKFSPPSRQQFTSSKPVSLSSSPRLILSENYSTFSEEDEEEEEPNTIVQASSQRETLKTNTDKSKHTSKSSNADHHSQLHAFLKSCHQNRTTSANTGFRFSLDDTDNEDLDTFSDLNSIRFNAKPVQTSPSVEEDFTRTDSRLLSSSGYQSLDRSGKSIKPRQPLLSKSHSENDLSHSSSKNDPQIKCIHYCPNCIHPPNITVIPPSIPTSTTIAQRFQQPVGEMLMKYLNFLLISKNVLLLPLLIFLFRQRSLYLRN